MDPVSSPDFICTKIDTSSASISSFPVQKPFSFGDIRTRCYKGWFLVRAAGSASWLGARMCQDWKVPGEGQAESWARMWEGRTRDRGHTLRGDQVECLCSYFLLGCREGHRPAPSCPMDGYRSGADEGCVGSQSSTPAVTSGRVGASWCPRRRGTWCRGKSPTGDPMCGFPSHTVLHPVSASTWVRSGTDQLRPAGYLQSAACFGTANELKMAFTFLNDLKKNILMTCSVSFRFHM